MKSLKTNPLNLFLLIAGILFVLPKAGYSQNKDSATYLTVDSAKFTGNVKFTGNTFFTGDFSVADSTGDQFRLFPAYPSIPFSDVLEVSTDVCNRLIIPQTYIII